MDFSRPQWRKSTRSGPETNCVEVPCPPCLVATRDGRHPAGPALIFLHTAWPAFVARAKSRSPDSR